MNVNIYIEGNNKFSPKKFAEISNLKLDIVVEPGEFFGHGRYKNKPCPYGIAWIMNIDTNDILKYKEFFEECFVELIVINIYEGDISGGDVLYIDKEIVKICSSLNASIEIVDFKSKSIQRDDKFKKIL